MKNIATYLRVSTEDQAREGFSLQNQEESNRLHITQKFGTDVNVVVYKDIESGYSTRRKDCLRLMADCLQKKIDALVVWRLDRFTRNTSDGLACLQTLTVTLGLPVFSVSEGQLDFNDPNNKFMSTVLTGMAELERNRIQQRVMPGMKKGAQLGHYQGTRHVIFGAHYNKPERRLEWIPQEVKVIQILFKTVASGESVHKTATYLYHQGYRNRFNKPLNKSLLCRIIKREIYCDGYYRWNGELSEKPIVEPIIDRATWEKANRVVSANKFAPAAYAKRSKRDDSPYILQGVLKCRNCGANLCGHRSKGVRYYVCSKKAGTTKLVCKGQTIKAEPIEDLAKGILKTIIEDPSTVKAAREATRQAWSERNPEIQANLRMGEKQLRELDTKVQKLLDLYYQNGLTADQFKSENDRLTHERGVVEQNLKQLRMKQVALIDQNKQIGNIFEILGNFHRMYEFSELVGRKNMFNWVFSFIHVKRLHKFRPIFKIDRYGLLYPFDGLLNKKLCDQNQNTSEKQPVLEIIGPSSTTLFHMAAK